MAPEAIWLENIARSLLPEKMKTSILAVSARVINPSEQLVQKNLGALELGTIDGFAWSTSFWKDFLGPFMFELKNRNGPVVYFNDDANVFAHEIGHIILNQGHDEDPGSLMVAGGKGSSISDTQCEKAKKFLEAFVKVPPGTK